MLGYSYNFRRETSILLIMSVLIIVFVKSHHFQLPFLSSSEPFSSDDVDPPLAVTRLTGFCRITLVRDPLRFTSLFFCFYSCVKTPKRGKTCMNTYVKCISKYLCFFQHMAFWYISSTFRPCYSIKETTITCIPTSYHKVGYLILATLWMQLTLYLI